MTEAEERHVDHALFGFCIVMFSGNVVASAETLPLVLLGNCRTEFLAESVRPLEQFLADTVVIYLPVAFDLSVDLIFKFVIEIDSLVYYLCHLVGVFTRVERDEKCAVINELPDDVLNVFFYVSKIHSDKNFNYSCAKIANIM